MKRLRGPALAVALTLVPLTSLPAFAQVQVPPLSQVINYGTAWSIHYPAGWFDNMSGLPVIGSTDGAVATLIQLGTPLPENTLAIGIIPPDGYAMFGVTPSSSVSDTIAAVATAFGGQPDITPVDGYGDGAVATPLTGATRLPAGANLLSVEKDGAVFTFIVIVENFADAAPFLQPIVNSLEVH